MDSSDSGEVPVLAPTAGDADRNELQGRWLYGGRQAAGEDASLRAPAARGAGPGGERNEPPLKS